MQTSEAGYFAAGDATTIPFNPNTVGVHIALLSNATSIKVC